MVTMHSTTAELLQLCLRCKLFSPGTYQRWYLQHVVWLANLAGMPLPATTSNRDWSLVAAVANAWKKPSASSIDSIDHLDQAVLQDVGEVLRIEVDPAVLHRPDHLHTTTEEAE